MPLLWCQKYVLLAIINYMIRWLRNFALLLCVIVVLMCANHVLDKIELIAIKNVKVYGARHVDHKQLQSLIVPCLNHNFFGVNLELIVEKLSQLPWVENVSVRRVWPDNVQIFIDERVPVAVWNHEAILSKDGALFSVDTLADFAYLPKFKGPYDKQNQMLAYFNNLQNLLQLCHLDIKEFIMTVDNMLEIKCSNGIYLRLGNKKVAKRLSDFVKVYPKMMRYSDNIEYVDLRYSNGMAVKWKNSSHVLKSEIVNYG